MKALPPGWGKDEQPAFEVNLALATQLFTVANLLAKDLRGTLKLVKQAGYDAVEFAGAFRHTAHDVRYALDESGLQVAGWHTPWDYLSPENIFATISYNKVICNQYIIVPWINDTVLSTAANCRSFARQLTWVSDVLGAYGMAAGFHNHTAEFRPTSDTNELPWDIIAQNTPSSFVMQNDIGNGMACGADMIQMLRKYPGRAATVHLKPYSPTKKGAFFDDPSCPINWDEYFTVCRKEAGVRWYIIEYLGKEIFQDDPIAAIAAASKWFRLQRL